MRANRLHNCGYGLAFVLGDPHGVSTAIDNTIIEPKFNGIDVIGDSPNLRRNQVLRRPRLRASCRGFPTAERAQGAVATFSGQQQLRLQPGQPDQCGRRWRPRTALAAAQ